MDQAIAQKTQKLKIRRREKRNVTETEATNDHITFLFLGPSLNVS